MSGWPYNTANWKRLRKAHLTAFPFCEGCEAMGRRYVIANTVDHIVPISDGGPAFPGHDGMTSYCRACHSAKTARGTEAGAVRSNKPRKGCDPDGNPLDPAHPWGNAVHAAAVKPEQKSLRAEARQPRPNRIIQLVQVQAGKDEQNGR